MSSSVASASLPQRPAAARAEGARTAPPAARDEAFRAHLDEADAPARPAPAASRTERSRDADRPRDTERSRDTDRPGDAERLRDAGRERETERTQAQASSRDDAETGAADAGDDDTVETAAGSAADALKDDASQPEAETAQAADPAATPPAPPQPDPTQVPPQAQPVDPALAAFVAVPLPTAAAAEAVPGPPAEGALPPGVARAADPALLRAAALAGREGKPGSRAADGAAQATPAGDAPDTDGTAATETTPAKGEAADAALAAKLRKALAGGDEARPETHKGEAKPAPAPAPAPVQGDVGRQAAVEQAKAAAGGETVPAEGKAHEAGKGKDGAAPVDGVAITVKTLAAEVPSSAQQPAPQPLPDTRGSQPAQAVAAPAPAAPQTPPTTLAMLPIEIGLRAMDGQQRFEIRLNPDELGRIDVRLDITSDGGVKAHLTVDRVETLNLLQRDSRTLERAFEQAGLRTSDSALQFSLGNGSQSQGGQAQQDQAAGRNAGRALPADDTGEAAARDIAAALRATRAAQGGLDIRI